MTIEDQKLKKKIHNAKYYQDNKEAILNKLAIKQECPYCKKMITLPYMLKHSSKGLCQRRYAGNIETLEVAKHNAENNLEKTT
jgi:hypothetical protein